MNIYLKKSNCDAILISLQSFLKKMREPTHSLGKYDLEQNIVITFGKDIPISLQREIINCLNEICLEIEQKKMDINLSFNKTKYIAQEIKKHILVENKALCRHLISGLEELIVSSNELTDYALEDIELSKILNSIEKSLYSLSDIEFIPLTQTFPNSCFACSILMVLKELKLIHEPTRTQELQIYKQIWLEPGKQSDIEKVILYLSQYKIKMIGLDFVEKTEDLLDLSNRIKNNRPELSQHIINQYTLFNQNKNKINQYSIQKIEDPYSINNEFFKGGFTFLISRSLSNQGLHVLFARIWQDQFQVIDPENGAVKLYPSFAEYYDSFENFKKEFTGVALHIVPD
ncbi:dehydrogenase [Legionella gratiana]|uniref:Dehydrogenase n=1 Tax=Legionella gratiana TaxID=45066 RepID=A0A378J9D7_9GAMM|nr:hypothetical protein [Legionella gratiana]KTD10634.1 dehydrogenase [Legionella gratiana]STX43581.1 dehydrogenase [Legionella gratiana]